MISFDNQEFCWKNLKTRPEGTPEYNYRHTPLLGHLGKYEMLVVKKEFSVGKISLSQTSCYSMIRWNWNKVNSYISALKPLPRLPNSSK